jgi:hypothetical protein
MSKTISWSLIATGRKATELEMLFIDQVNKIEYKLSGSGIRLIKQPRRKTRVINRKSKKSYTKIMPAYTIPLAGAPDPKLELILYSPTTVNDYPGYLLLLTISNPIDMSITVSCNGSGARGLLTNVTSLRKYIDSRFSKLVRTNVGPRTVSHRLPVNQIPGLKVALITMENIAKAIVG